ncbi:MAG: SH3 domain-containing protein [Rhizobiaceae bacterium]
MSSLAIALRLLCLTALCAGLAATGPSPAIAQTQSQNVQLGPSGLPLPRFVSLRAPRANLRVGPGTNYAVQWTFVRSGVPLEIVQEYDNWRRVRDAEGAEGWINHSLLSGNRTAVVAPWERGQIPELPLRAQPNETARIVARLEPGLMGAVRSCDGQWCEMDFSGVRGWIPQSRLWGAYPGETYRN